MWLTRVLNIVRVNEPIIKNHTNEITGVIPQKLDKAWGRRKVKMMTAHLYGRQRNCYRLAVIKMGNYLRRTTKGTLINNLDKNC